MNSLRNRIILAFLITIVAAGYQRITGPTYPIKGHVNLNGAEVEYRLDRSHGGEGDQPVVISVSDPEVEAVLVYRKYKSGQPWRGMAMVQSDNVLMAALPHQPPAGKLEYFIFAAYNGERLTIPDGVSAVTRFKGEVPLTVLIPHVLFMFTAMFFSSLTALEAWKGLRYTNRFVLITTILLFIGGMILGPIVQKFAFGEYWTGIPFGIDLTDNKTLIAVAAWGLALLAVFREKQVKLYAISAAVIMLLVYSIPHSTMGSELNYQTGQIQSSR